MCITPIKVHGSEFPCRRCPVCINRRIAQWSFRLMEELKVSTSAKFITLTYDEKYAPTDLFGNLSVRKRDLVLFFKRLRKAHEGVSSRFVVAPQYMEGASLGNIQFSFDQRSIKYLGVGEYGSRTFRPHYHVILFNSQLELVKDAWGQKDKSGNLLFHYGHVDFGDERGVSEASVGYCFKYLSKCYQKSRKFDRYWDGELREPNFMVSSKGIGVSYLDNEEMMQWHGADIENRMYCVVPNGNKVSMPRYYKDKIFFDGERLVAVDRMVDKFLAEVSRMSERDVRNQKASIDAAFQRMHEKYYLTNSIF